MMQKQTAEKYTKAAINVLSLLKGGTKIRSSLLMARKKRRSDVTVFATGRGG
jgi:hypothetical protein